MDINKIRVSYGGSNKVLFDEWTGLDSGILTPEEILDLRTPVYRSFAGETEGPVFVKIHDALIRSQTGCPLVPPDLTRGVLYFIRSPLDGCLSYANHMSIDVDKAIEQMGNSETHLAGIPRWQLTQPLLSWSEHVASWLGSDLPTKMIRYEDMRSESPDLFLSAANFAGLETTREEVKDALGRCRLEDLKRQEAEVGFREKPPNVTSFFRSGRVGEWKDRLTQEQVARILELQGPMMKQVGYLDEDGKPILTS